MKLKKRRTVLIVLLAVLFALIVTGFVLLKHSLSRIDRTYNDPVEIIAPENEFFETDPEPEATPSQGVTEPVEEPVQPTEDPNVLPSGPSGVEWSFIDSIEDDHLINILLIGQDGGWETKTRQHSDSMILCSVNPETGKVALISFLRDTYVQIPGGYSDNRLNMPYLLGGFDLLDQTLEANFGISVDANIAINFTGFEAIVDYLGGLDVNLSAAEVEHIERVWGLDVEEGLNHLDGRYALNYVRMRKVGNDFGRSQRQRTAILTLLDKVKDLPVSQLLTLVYDMLPYLSTDLTDSEILALAYRLLPMVSSLSIENHMVPDHDCYTAAKIRNMSVLVPDRDRIRQRLEEEYLPLK